METIALCLLALLLIGYAFAFGCEYSYRSRLKSIIPHRITNPRFRVIYRNPNIKSTQGRKNSLERR